MNPEDSKWLLFDKLPKVSIHSPTPDVYSKHYVARQQCDCGCVMFNESTMIMFDGMPPRDVHRCAMCNEVRLCDKIP